MGVLVTSLVSQRQSPPSENRVSKVRRERTQHCQEKAERDEECAWMSDKRGPGRDIREKDG